MCRQKLRNEVPAARNLALSCHPRLISPGSLLLHIKTCDRLRRCAMKRDEVRSRSWRPDLFAETHEQAARAARGRLVDNGVTLGERFRRLSEHKLCKAAIVFAAVKCRRWRADLEYCSARQPCKSWLVWRCPKRQSSASLSSNRVALAGQNNAVPLAVTDAGTQQRTSGISWLAAVLDVQSESSRSANQSHPGSCPMTGRRRARRSNILPVPAPSSDTDGAGNLGMAERQTASPTRPRKAANCATDAK
jgi:hypothetical protein